jgi:glyceraldehyde-3-phosphate dehydrogenase (EC 1.2.1.12)
MTINIAINGFGRIGRNICRALHQHAHANHIRLVAINDLGNVETNAHLLKYDSTHGIFNADIKVDKENQNIIIDGNVVQVFSERDPSQLPWNDVTKGDKNHRADKPVRVDVVLECTGLFRSKEDASLHLQAGAKKY